jgi:molybdate transport system ATP-binding protein
MMAAGADATAAGRAPRLHMAVRRTVPGFTLDAQLDACDEVLVLFGPSGAGKTTILNMVAGLVRPDAGEIVVDDTVVFGYVQGAARHVPARDRGIGYVMQSYALFPHMSALENVMFPLARAADRRERAAALLELLGIAEHAARRPAQLSGGQQQRVAIARALAAERRLLLLDEPFAALDGRTRDRLQADLRRIRAGLGITALLVTHQLEDAFAVGDRIAVMRSGRIEQVGPVRSVFERPATAGVAGLLGIRNVFEADVVRSDDDALDLDWDGIRIGLPPHHGLETGTRVTAYVRADDVKFVYPDRPLNESIAGTVIDAQVVAERASAGARLVWVRLANGRELEVRFPLLSYAQLPLRPGTAVRVALRREGVTVLRPPPAPDRK